MARVICCVEHKRYEGLDFTPIEPQEEGHVLADSILVNGKVHLDCHFCSWATPPAMDTSDTPCPVCHGEVGHRVNCPNGIAFSKDLPAVETALGSVGNPTERKIRGNDANQVLSEYDAPEIVAPKRKKKEKNVAKTETAPKKRGRRRGKTYSRTIGGIELILQVRGDLDAFMELDEQQAGGIRAIIKSIKAETPKGA